MTGRERGQQRGRRAHNLPGPAQKGVEAPRSKSENFKTVTAEHETTCGDLRDCTGHTPMRRLWEGGPRLEGRGPAGAQGGQERPVEAEEG